MIVDAHIHVFPHLGGTAGFSDLETHRASHQYKVERWWGRMLTNTLDERYMPLAGENVGFRVGKFGRYEWNKNGKHCWMQRFPLALEEVEWSPERMVAHMDAIGVDAGVLQAGYMELNFCRSYFDEAVRKFPDRFISTVAIDYDLARDDAYLQAELEKLRFAFHEQNARGVYQGYVKGQPVDDPRFDAFWQTYCDLSIPHITQTGFEATPRYLDSLVRLERTARKFPQLKLVIGHLGGNVRHPEHPGFTDTPNELLPLLRLPNVYFEVGYVLAYENREIWGDDYEYPYPRHESVIKRIYEEIGADRMIWGSDMPFVERTCTYRQCLDLVRVHCKFMSAEEKERVMGKTAADLFGVKPRTAISGEASPRGEARV